MIKMTKSQNAEADRQALLNACADRQSCNIVLYADDEMLAYIMLDEETGGRPYFVIWTMLSDKQPWAKEDAAFPTTEPFEWEGRKYLPMTTEISQVTPVDQSDLSSPGAIAAKTPEQYETYESMHACWSNPESKEIKDSLASIVKRTEMETAGT
jgi:hypothetical protein